MFSRILTFAAVALGLALPAASMGCAAESANDAPIIDSVDAPLSVNEQNGAYTIPITLLFHDNDGEAITRLRYRLPPSIDGIVDVPAPNPTKVSARVTIVIPVSALDAEDAADTSLTARGDNMKDADEAKRPGESPGRAARQGRGKARALTLTVVDGRGAESLPLSSSVTLN